VGLVYYINHGDLNRVIQLALDEPITVTESFLSNKHTTTLSEGASSNFLKNLSNCSYKQVKKDFDCSLSSVMYSFYASEKEKQPFFKFVIKV